MKLSPTQMMGAAFAAQLPMLALRLLITENLLRRVWHEMPELRDSDLGGDIFAAITAPNSHLAEGTLMDDDVNKSAAAQHTASKALIVSRPSLETSDLLGSSRHADCPPRSRPQALEARMGAVERQLLQLQHTSPANPFQERSFRNGRCLDTSAPQLHAKTEP